MSEDLTDEELDYLRERIMILFADKEGMSAEMCLMLSYIQGMVECLITVTSPEINTYAGAEVLLNLAKRAGGLTIHAIKERKGPNPRRN